MNKRPIISLMAVLLTMTLIACGNNNKQSVESKEPEATSSEQAPSSKPATSSSPKESSSKGPVKSVTDLSISLGNENSKAYITVRGTQSNYTADDFKWAWGLKAEDGTFDDGKSNPADADFTKATFDSNNAFTVKYCLTDIATMRAGVIYTIYGGTPESYGAIQFASNQFGANDGMRKYYLRSDKDNALIFDSIQPVTYSKASVVEVKEADLPEGVTQTGAYLKLGGTNSKNLTMEMVEEWHKAGNIAGDFQRVIGDGYSVHSHADTERFWKIEGNEFYIYLYVGFIAEGEGWMLHLDLVGGSSNAGAGTSVTFNGETPYIIDGAMYKIYSDSNKGGEENYWGCVGVYREVSA